MKHSKIILTLLTASFGLTVCATDTLQPWQKAAIATRFASEVKYNYVGYDKFAQDFDSICRAQLPEIVNTSSDEAFQQKLTLLANTLHDGHTSISWSADVTTPPFSQKRIGDKVFITEVFSDEYRDKGVAKGTELIEINGTPILVYAKTHVEPYIPSSTPQWSAYFSTSSINLTKGKRGEPMSFKFRNGKGKPFIITDDMTAPWGRVNPDLSPKFEALPGNIGLLRIPSLRYNLFNVEEVLDLYNQKILPTDGLIVDIRDNNGGNSQVGDFIMMLLATDTIPVGAWETPKYSAAYASWGQPRQKESVNGEPLIPFYLQTSEITKYDKPIVLLINAGTFSAAENFAALFKNAKRGVIIGTPTGGSTGNPINIDLGYGYWGRICTRNEKLADGTDFVGVGIQPDITLQENESVINGADNIIQAALNHLSRK